MHQQTHTLLAATPGTTQQLISLHYGRPVAEGGTGPKVVIQASLHADEVPAMLVAHHLRQHLDALEAQGCINGEVVLVPMANPVGAHQWLLRGFQGRFDVATGENFNRHYPSLADAVLRSVGDRLGGDGATNARLVRQGLSSAVRGLSAKSTLESLRNTLLGLACDADAVLDLHCDGEGVLHLYTTPEAWGQGVSQSPVHGQGQLLARCIGAKAALLAERSGGEPFDEACSQLWADVRAKLGAKVPLAGGCMAATIELRGEADVRHDLARQDAVGLVRFLEEIGAVRSDTAEARAPLPAACEATPLAGSIPLIAPHGGMIVFLREPGVQVSAGEPLVDLIDPLTAHATTLAAPVAGHFFARDLRRFAHAGMTLGKVAGTRALREGALLSA